MALRRHLIHQPRASGLFVRPKSTLVNQLSSSSSPYLQGHQLNPVAWQKWSQGTLDLAKELNRPIFLSIGYSACHWCHVMNDESFSNPAVAKVLNMDFVPIKVDKEEWPDIDTIYMTYLQATLGHGGWPLNVFLIPGTLRPFFGGTYWAGPDVDGAQVKSLRAIQFLDVLDAVSKQWKTSPNKCIESADRVSETLIKLIDSKSSEEPVELDEETLLANIQEHLDKSADWVNGGFGDAPKFVLAYTLRFIFANKKLLSPELVKFADFTLEKIYRGGIKDQIGHGVSRYSVTADWHLPHFEKMLYDQALLLDTCLLSSTPVARELANDICDFLIQGLLTSPNGAWYSAVDADSLTEREEFREGAYYVWTAQEAGDALKDLPLLDRDICAMYWGIEDNGNVNPDLDAHGEFQHKNVLSAHKTVDEVAAAFGRSPEEVARIIEGARVDMLNWRESHRVVPDVDTKLVTGWNGIALGALAQASWKLDRKDALTAAATAANALRDQNWDGQLYRTSDKIPSVNDDYAYLISGLLDLYEATFNADYLQWALTLQAQQFDKFLDPRGGFFTSQPWSWLMYRPKIGFDSAEPASNGISAHNLARLNAITADPMYTDRFDQLVRCYSADIARQPAGYLSILGPYVADSANKSVVVVGDDDIAATELLPEVRKRQEAGYSAVRLDHHSVPFLPHRKQMWIDSATTELVATQEAEAA